MRLHLLVLLGFAIGAIIITWPLILHPTDSVLDPGDPLFTSWILGWVNHALFHSPMDVFNPPVFYPERGALLYSETLLLPSILVAPVFALGGSAILAHNLLFFLSFIFAGYFFYLMCRELGLSFPASSIGAVLFDFGPYRMDFSHVQLSQLQYLPLLILFVNRYFRMRRARDLIFAWLCFAATTLSCSYYGVYALLLMALLHLFYLAANARSLTIRSMFQLAVAPLPAAALLVPYYAEYAKISHLYTFQRSIKDILDLQADVVEYANYFYHSLLFPNLGRSLGSPMYPYLTPGIVWTVLAALACVLVRTAGSPLFALRSLRRLALAALLAVSTASAAGWIRPESQALQVALFAFLVSWLTEILSKNLKADQDVRPAAFAWIAILAAVLSLGLQVHLAGRIIGPGIYGVFHSYFPGFWGIRAVYRVSVLFFLCGSIVAAYSVDALRKRGWLPPAAAILLLVFGFIERMNAPIPWVLYRTRDPEAYAWLEKQPGHGAVLELPLRTFLAPYAVMYESLGHGRPVLNGVSGFVPRAHDERMAAIETWPSDGSRDLLEGMLPLEFVLRHQEAAGSFQGNTYEGLGESTFLHHLARFGTTDLYRVRHDFREERDRSHLRLYVDPRIHGGKQVDFEVRPSVDDGVQRTVEIGIGQSLLETIRLNRSRHVSLDFGRIPPQGGWVDLRCTVERANEWQFLDWQLVSETRSSASCILLDGKAWGLPKPNGILLAATDGRQDEAKFRFIDTLSEIDSGRKIKEFLSRNKKKRYIFVVAAGSALEGAPEDLRSTLADVTGCDPGRGAFALALLRPGSTLHRRAPEMRMQAGETRAVLREGGHGFVLTNLRIR